jgi:secreted PhoX family phosphatase
MNQVNETGPNAHRYLYRTHEVGTNGSVSVTDLTTGETTVLAQRADWRRFDGLKWTPWKTLLAAEETSNVPAALRDPDFPNAVHGLAYEIDPMTGDAIARPALGSLAHEGIGIDHNGNVYVIDEFATGGLFKFVPDTKTDLSSGQLYALRITDESVAPGAKTGEAEWLPLDRDAVQIDARAAAAAAGATPYGRPEDVEIGKNVLYVAITS